MLNLVALSAFDGALAQVRPSVLDFDSREEAAYALKAREFGALGSGKDETTELRRLFEEAMTTGQWIFLSGTYHVAGPLLSPRRWPSANLKIFCDGDVQILVDPAAPPFRDLIYCESLTPANSAISGGSLTIDLSGRCASGITVRHHAREQGGVVHWSAPVTIRNCLNNDPSATFENQAILIFGNFASVWMDRPQVVSVDRRNTAGGACKGISIAGFSGTVWLDRPRVEAVMCTGGKVDADGIATFGLREGGAYHSRQGQAILNEPEFIDCQGRSFKSQCSESLVIRPKVRRRYVVSITHSADFDFQFGNGLLVEPEFDYRANAGISPLGISHSCVVFQQTLDDTPMHGRSLGGVVRTEVSIPRYAVAIHQRGARDSLTEVDGLKIEAIGPMLTTAVQRAILETGMQTIAEKEGKTRLRVANVTGPLQCAAIGYTDLASATNVENLGWLVENVTNTAGVSPMARPFAALNGAKLTGVGEALAQGNVGLLEAGLPRAAR